MRSGVGMLVRGMYAGEVEFDGEVGERTWAAPIARDHEDGDEVI